MCRTVSGASYDTFEVWGCRDGGAAGNVPCCTLVLLLSMPGCSCDMRAW
jgi:hypothetical protein